MSDSAKNEFVQIHVYEIDELAKAMPDGPKKQWAEMVVKKNPMGQKVHACAKQIQRCREIVKEAKDAKNVSGQHESDVDVDAESLEGADDSGRTSESGPPESTGLPTSDDVVD